MAVLAWTLLPLLALHALFAWRWRSLLRFQLLLDLGLAAVVAPALLLGADLSPVRCLQNAPPFEAWEWYGSTELQLAQSDVTLQFHPWWREARRELAAGAAAAGLRADRRRPAPARQRPDRSVGTGDAAGVGARSGAGDHGDGAVEAGDGRPWRLPAVALRLPGGLARGGGGRPRLRIGLLPGGVVAGAAGLGHGRAAVGVVGGAGCPAPAGATVGPGPGRAGSRLAPGLRPPPGDRRHRLRLGLAGRAGPPPPAVAAGRGDGGGRAAGGCGPRLAHGGGGPGLAKVAQHREDAPNRRGLPLQVQLAAVQQLLVPLAHGHPARGSDAPYPYPSAATGAGGLVLGLLAAGAVRRRRQRHLLAALASLAVAAVLAYRVPPLDWLLVRLPPFDRMTLPRFAALVPLALALWAGLATEGLSRGLRRGAAWRALAPLLVLAAAASAGAWALPWPDLALVAAGFGLAVVVAVAPSRTGWLAPLLACETALLAVGVNPLAAPSDRLPRPPLVAALAAAVEAEGGRVIGVGGALPPNLASGYGLSDLRAFDPVRPQAFSRLMGLLGEADPVVGGAHSLPRPRSSSGRGRCASWCRRPAWRPRGGTWCGRTTRALSFATPAGCRSCGWWGRP